MSLAYWGSRPLRWGGSTGPTLHVDPRLEWAHRTVVSFDEEVEDLIVLVVEFLEFRSDVVRE